MDGKPKSRQSSKRSGLSMTRVLRSAILPRDIRSPPGFGIRGRSVDACDCVGFQTFCRLTRPLVLERTRKGSLYIDRGVAIVLFDRLQESLAVALGVALLSVGRPTTSNSISGITRQHLSSTFSSSLHSDFAPYRRPRLVGSLCTWSTM